MKEELEKHSQPDTAQDAAIGVDLSVIRRPFMIDLCAGLGGASQAMKERGWHVITLDSDSSFNTDIVADVRAWSWQGERPDLVWGSPPCDEFAREFMPWSKTGRVPDVSIVKACKRIIQETNPRYWIIENVQGAVKYFKPILGDPATIFKPFFFWGYFPDLGDLKFEYRKKESYSSKRKAERAKIPYEISLAFAMQIEQQESFIDHLAV